MAKIDFFLDPQFKNGFSVHGPRHEDGIVAHFPEGSKGRTVWCVAQWGNYRYPVTADTEMRGLSGGGFELSTPTATVTAHPADKDCDLRLELRSSAEYGGRMRKDGEDWCHLLVEQGDILSHAAPLNKLKELRYRAELRLDYWASRIDPAVYDPKHHSCQFCQYITVQDIQSGDFIWFGIPFFDSRYRRFPGYIGADSGKADATGWIIINQEQQAFTEGVAASGDWVSYDVDLLPLIARAIKIAWGYHQFERDNWDHVVIGSTNFGFEMFYPFDAAVSVRGMSLTGETAAENEPGMLETYLKTPEEIV